MGSAPLLIVRKFVSAYLSPSEAREPMTECSELPGPKEPSGSAQSDSDRDPAGPVGLDGIGQHGESLGATRLLLPVGVSMGS